MSGPIRRRWRPTCSASTSPSTRRARRWAPPRRRTRWRSSSCSPTSAALAPERRGEDGGAPPHEHFNAFLRSLDAEREGLPPWYVERLLRALGHYRVTSLDPSPDLERALLRMFTSQQRLRRGGRRRDGRARAAARGGRRGRAAAVSGGRPRPPDRGGPAAVPGPDQHRPGRPSPLLRPPALRAPRGRGRRRDARRARRLDRLGTGTRARPSPRPPGRVAAAVDGGAQRGTVG